MHTGTIAACGVTPDRCSDCTLQSSGIVLPFLALLQRPSRSCWVTIHRTRHLWSELRSVNSLVVQRSTRQAEPPPLGRASIVDSYWPDFGIFAMLYSFVLPLLAIRVVRGPTMTVRDPAIAVRVGSILVSDTYWF